MDVKHTSRTFSSCKSRPRAHPDFLTQDVVLWEQSRTLLFSMADLCPVFCVQVVDASERTPVFLACFQLFPVPLTQKHWFHSSSSFLNTYFQPLTVHLFLCFYCPLVHSIDIYSAGPLGRELFPVLRYRREQGGRRLLSALAPPQPPPPKPQPDVASVVSVCSFQPCYLCRLLIAMIFPQRVKR